MSIIKIEHCRKLKYCASGIRAMAVRYNLDYTKFLKEGIDSEILLSKITDDGMVNDLIRIAADGR